MVVLAQAALGQDKNLVGVAGQAKRGLLVTPLLILGMEEMELHLQ